MTYLKQFRKCPENTDYSLDEWRTQLWKKALGDSYAHLAKETYDRWLQLRYQYLELSTQVRELLQRLRKTYYVGLITNGTSNAQREKVQKLSLERYFDIILVSGDLPWSKPETRIFEEACRCLRVSPENCIMVGDKLETDIIGKWSICGFVRHSFFTAK